jgi:hypothetical protein
VPAKDALKRAHILALEQLAASCQDDRAQRDLEWATEIVRSDYAPPTLDLADLARCVGEYGRRTFSIENGELIYGHQDLPVAWTLIPMSKTRFHLDQDVKFEFLVDQDDTASAVTIWYRDGRPTMTADRTE